MLECRKSKYQKIRDKVELKMNELDMILRVIEHCEVKENDNLETIVLKKYIEFENVTEVANSINELGYRIKTNSHVGVRKYTTNDISNILTDNDIDVEKELKESTATMFKHNRGIAYKSY